MVTWRAYTTEDGGRAYFGSGDGHAINGGEDSLNSTASLQERIRGNNGVDIEFAKCITRLTMT